MPVTGKENRDDQLSEPLGVWGKLFREEPRGEGLLESSEVCHGNNK